MTSWKRPDSVPHPKVWRRAVGRKPVDGKVPSFVIQDVPEDREEELVQFMVENFVRNEPLSRCLNSSNDPFKGETASKIMKLLDYLDSLADPFEKYGVEEYIAAMGLSVAKEFQGQGLGKELLKARFDVGRAVGVKLTVTAFTAIESQVLATREGFEELARIDYKDYKVDGKEVFPGITSKCAILMAKRI
ncbi:uncharacterized protein LOC134543028 isoform X3 [Bacillus rossius redtenbacheri]|uniref:uncharacterized protein LOC134543028 isoform X3 n=1 Tax=Bacillus rossius redtenbacheri TaxID=93214 RepID=UPI002FDCA947